MTNLAENLTASAQNQGERTASRLDEYSLTYRQLLDADGAASRELFGLALEDLDFDEGVIRVRRQIKPLGQTWVCALPKNGKERVVPMSPRLAALGKEHIETFGTTKITLPWERVDGELRTHALLFT